MRRLSSLAVLAMIPCIATAFLAVSASSAPPPSQTGPKPVAPAVVTQDVRPESQVPGVDHLNGASPTAAGIIRITTVVTDSMDRPVANLAPSEFELLEDGVRQTIETVEPRTGGRLFVFLLDEFHVSAGDATSAVREAVSRFIEELGLEDRVFVLKPLESLTSIRFSEDREVSRRSVASFEGRGGDYTPRTPFEMQLMARAPEIVREERASIVTAGLRELAAQIGRTSDRRAAIALVSEGFVARPDPGSGRVASLPSVIRLASRFDVPIYSFVPGAVRDDAQTSGSPTAEATQPGSTLRRMADETGGIMARGSDLLPALRRMASDLQTSYRLTYRSSAGTDGKFHAIEVRTTRGLKVRARPGYWAAFLEVNRTSRAGIASPRAPRARLLRRSPLIEPWLGMIRNPDGRARITLTWQPRQRPFSTPGPRVEPRLVLLKAATAGGEPLFEGRIAPVGGVAGAAAPLSAIFAAPPGRLELDLSIQSLDGTLLDSDARDIEVPELTGTRPMILPPEVLRTSTEREFRAALADPDAPPVPAREFRRVERLLVRAPAYDADGATLAVRAKLLNRAGQTMWELTAIPTETRDGLTQFDVALARLAPGEYEIELVASSAAGEVKERLRFRVTG